MLKTLSMALMLCPDRFSGVVNAVFYVQMSQIDTENDKKHEVYQFSKFLCVSFQIFVHTGKSVLSSGLL